MEYILAFLVGFIICVLLMPLIIKYCKRLKFGQNVLHYVESHSQKQGTPTMGGITFIFAGIVASLIFINQSYSFALISLAIFLAYGVLGFLDDFIKIKFKRNLGLRAYQKIIGQVSLALIIAFFVYFSPLIDNSITLPFTDIKIYLGWGIIPFILVLFLAATNAVNLTDGLDGLAGGTTLVYLLGFAAISYLYLNNFTQGLESEQILQNTNVIIVCLAVAGSLLGFLCFNGYPAKIFMGDTGSLALGALVAVTSVFNGLELFILLLGFMFVLSAASVIIQVLYFKKTKKRIFLMAPLHHHYEKKGVHETKIVTIYIIITVIISLICVLLTIMCRG